MSGSPHDQPRPKRARRDVVDRSHECWDRANQSPGTTGAWWAIAAGLYAVAASIEKAGPEHKIIDALHDVRDLCDEIVKAVDSLRIAD